MNFRALGHVTCMYSHLFLPCLQFLLPLRVVAFHGESVELFYLVHLEILWRYHLRTFRSAFTTTTAIFSFVVVPSWVLITWFPNTSAIFGVQRRFTKVWPQKVWVLEWQGKLWPHCNVGRLKRKNQDGDRIRVSRRNVKFFTRTGNGVAFVYRWATVSYA